MLKRYGLWLADWYDENGQRKRKGFKTQRSAIAFQNRMKEKSGSAKKIRASRAPASSSRPTAKASRPAPRTLRRKT